LLNHTYLYRFEYTIKSGNEKGYFKIQKTTGLIQTTKALDREDIASFQLSIVAQDIDKTCHKGQ